MIYDGTPDSANEVMELIGDLNGSEPTGTINVTALVYRGFVIPVGASVTREGDHVEIL